MFELGRKIDMPSPMRALPGRSDPVMTAVRHYVFDRPLKPPYPRAMRSVLFGMGCFWGAERRFWRLGQDAIWITAVGYAGGLTPNPTYEEVCSGMTGHAEVVLVAYDPNRIDYLSLLKVFWESHNPTQGMRQGADIGTQYRSAIYAMNESDLEAAAATRAAYDRVLRAQGHGAITTELAKAPPFYFAESGHQQYLAKNPNGYCALGGVGVPCQIESDL